MNNRNIQKVDKQGRITISLNLLAFVGINLKGKIALCVRDEDLFIRNTDDVKDLKVIDIISIDEKGRIILPCKIR